MESQTGKGYQKNIMNRDQNYMMVKYRPLCNIKGMIKNEIQLDIYTMWYSSVI